jgi:hypothetical protein
MRDTTQRAKRIEPRESSQEAIILKRLKRGWKISNIIAVERYRICRLSAVVNRLREKHWPIKTIDKKMKDGSLYGEYVLRKA